MSIYNNIRDRYYIYRIQKDSDFFRRISSPSFKLVSFMMKFNAGLIRENHTVSTDVMSRMVGRDPSSIRYFHSPDKRVVWQATMKDPNVLKMLDLNNEQQMYVYSQNHKTFDYIRNPTETLQTTAVLDNWTKAMTIKDLSPSACDAFLSSALGVNPESASEVREAAYKLISDWREIARENSGVIEMNDVSMPMYRKLAENEIKEIPDYLKMNITHERYKNSIIEFQQNTGLELSLSAPVFQPSANNDPAMTEALRKGVENTASESAKSVEDIYMSCADEIIRKKNEIEGADSLSREQIDGILGKENTDKLESVLRENGKTLSDLSGKDVIDLANSGKASVAGGSMLQKISGPAGYAMRAYSYMDTMSSLGQCEM